MTEVYVRELSEAEDARAAAYALIREVLRLPSLELVHDARGKPQIPGGPEVSLSHTKTAAAAAFGEGPVGVDIERLRPIVPGLPKRVLSGPEYDWFLSRGQRPEDFFTLWTLKESYYKYLGTGLPGIPNGTAFYTENGAWRLAGTDLRFDVYAKNLLRAALCSRAQQVRWINLSES